MNWLIIRVAGADWVAEVANTNIRYLFAGNGAQQLENVQAFARSMADGNAGVSRFLDLDGVGPARVQQQLFGDTNRVVFEDVTGPVSETNLFDILDEVGEFILELI